MQYYDRHLTVRYAHDWAYSRNPAFYDFAALGGDCTNFVSQCLLAGGMPMNFEKGCGWYWRNLHDRSPSFTGVQFLYDFLINNKKTGPHGKAVPLSLLLPGDIIQISFDGQAFSHSVLVVEKSPENEILVATHNTDCDRRPINSYAWEALRGIGIS